jgi:hypothetical protein
MNDLQDCDDLITAWSLSYGKSMQNGNDPVTRYILDSSNPVLLTPDCNLNLVSLPTVDHRDPPKFDINDVDWTALEMINSCEHLDSATENSSDPSEWIDSMVADGPPMLTERFEEFDPPLYPQLPNTASFSYNQLQPQFINSNPNSIPHVFSPIDNCHQQSSSSYISGLQYHPLAPPQPISPSRYYFGSTQVAPVTADIQVPSTYDFDASSLSSPIKKSIKTNRKRTPTYPGLKCGVGIDINDWYVKDENGKKRRPLLHEFLRMSLDNENYSHIVRYVDKRQGIFKFYDRNKAAELWELVKARNSDMSKFHFIYYYLNNI